MRFHKLEGHLRSRYGDWFMGHDEGSANFADLLRSAQKFYFGNVSQLPRASLTNFPRLPYELCAFEFEDVDPKGVLRPFILLAEDLVAYGLDTVRIHSFMPYAADLSFWVHTGFIEIDRFGEQAFRVNLNVRTRKFFDGNGHDLPKLADATAMEASLKAGSYWLADALEVLNCTNVAVDTIPQPAKLNKQRNKRGKLPLYEYKVLVLKGDGASVGSRALGGSHESPRVHLRRGHIKRRKTGNFWWQPHVVGNRSKGMVVKDYSFAMGAG